MSSLSLLVRARQRPKVDLAACAQHSRWWPERSARSAERSGQKFAPPPPAGAFSLTALHQKQMIIRDPVLVVLLWPSVVALSTWIAGNPHRRKQ
jgi:hypothetical protein